MFRSGNTHVVDIYDENYDVEEDFVDGKCEVYRGLVCYKYLAGLAVFVRSDEEQRDAESRLQGESVDVSVTLGSLCRSSERWCCAAHTVLPVSRNKLTPLLLTPGSFYFGIF